MRPPRQVLLFTGHMIDVPTRPVPRFPPDRETAVAQRIGECLAALDAGPQDLALTQGAAGGDLLFAEACVARGVRLRFLQPLPEAGFIEQSILSVIDGARWQQRYLALRPALVTSPETLPPDDTGADPFARCNDWLLDTAASWGVERLHLICLWDGQGGDGTGGTAHLREAALRRGLPLSRIARIDPCETL